MLSLILMLSLYFRLLIVFFEKVAEMNLNLKFEFEYFYMILLCEFVKNFDVFFAFGVWISIHAICMVATCTGAQCTAYLPLISSNHHSSYTEELQSTRKATLVIQYGDQFALWC